VNAPEAGLAEVLSFLPNRPNRDRCWMIIGEFEVTRRVRAELAWEAGSPLARDGARRARRVTCCFILWKEVICTESYCERPPSKSNMIFKSRNSPSPQSRSRPRCLNCLVSASSIGRSKTRSLRFFRCAQLFTPRTLLAQNVRSNSIDRVSAISDSLSIPARKSPRSGHIH
jgi:hypothetical protein